MLKTFLKTLHFLLLFFFLCGFEPKDIVFKNIDLLPDFNEKIDVIDIKSHTKVLNEKGEKLYDRPKIPEIKTEGKPAEDLLKVKGVLKEHVFTNQGEIIKTFTPTPKAIDNMFHLSDIGIKLPQSGGKPPEMSTIKDEAKTFPALIKTSGMEVYKKDNWIITNIAEIKAVGINDLDIIIVPKSMLPPLTPKDWDPQPIFDGIFPSATTPDDVLGTEVLDIIP